MSVHVDVVKNEWLTGEQRPIARLFVGRGELQIDSPDPARWGPVVEQALDGLKLDDVEPAERLEELSTRLRGSHLNGAARPRRVPLPGNLGVDQDGFGVILAACG